MRELTDVLKRQKIQYTCDLHGSELCTIGIGGVVPLVIRPACVGELIDSVDACRAFGVPYAVIGHGSNLLISDAPGRIAIIQTGALDAFQQVSENRFWSLCGTSLIKLCAAVARCGFADLAFACGIPGSVGGAAYMNAGAYGSEMANVVEQVEIYDPKCRKIRTIFNKELSCSYRYCSLQCENVVVLSVTLQVKNVADPSEILRQMRDLNAARRAKQPLELPSAGSAFKRISPELSSAKLIAQSGLSGLRIGGAQISEKHTGFIVNVGGATALDVRRLMRIVQETLEKEYGCRPDPEIRFLPEDI